MWWTTGSSSQHLGQRASRRTHPRATYRALQVYPWTLTSSHPCLRGSQLHLLRRGGRRVRVQPQGRDGSEGRWSHRFFHPVTLSVDPPFSEVRLLCCYTFEMTSEVFPFFFLRITHDIRCFPVSFFLRII